MSEKRFEVDVDHLLLVWDTEKNKRLEIEDVVGVLNEQQSTIRSLQNKNIILKNRIEDLKTSIHFQDKELQRLLQQSKESVKR